MHTVPKGVSEKTKICIVIFGAQWRHLGVTVAWDLDGSDRLTHEVIQGNVGVTAGVDQYVDDTGIPNVSAALVSEKEAVNE